jgi:hypothetical protein
LYVPAPQGVHSVPSGPVYPARQIQFVRRILLSFEKVLIGHVVQVGAAANEYVFSLHGVQAEGVAFSARDVPAGHIVQALTSDMYVPPGHDDEQLLAPSTLYVSALHAVHNTPSNEAMYPARQVHIGLFASEKELS